MPRGGGKWRRGLWSREAAEANPGDIDGQIAALVEPLTKDLSVWRELSKRYEPDIFLGVFLTEYNEGIAILPTTLQLVAERHLVLDFDIYAS